MISDNDSLFSTDSEAQRTPRTSSTRLLLSTPNQASTEIVTTEEKYNHKEKF